MSIEDKYDEVRQLITIGKEKGYLLYDEVNDLLRSDITSPDELDDLFNTFGTAGIEVVDSEQKYREDKQAEGEELELDLTPGALDKTNDPVRMYLREMGTVPLLTREGEVEIAKRIERGKLAVIKSISRTPTSRPQGHRDGRQPEGRRAHDPRAGDLQRRGDHRRAHRGAHARGSQADRRGAQGAPGVREDAREARGHAEEGQEEVPQGALEGDARARRACRS